MKMEMKKENGKRVSSHSEQRHRSSRLAVGLQHQNKQTNERTNKSLTRSPLSPACSTKPTGRASCRPRHATTTTHPHAATTTTTESARGPPTTAVAAATPATIPIGRAATIPHHVPHQATKPRACPKSATTQPPAPGRMGIRRVWLLARRVVVRVGSAAAASTAASATSATSAPSTCAPGVATTRSIAARSSGARRETRANEVERQHQNDALGKRCNETVSSWPSTAPRRNNNTKPLATPTVHIPA